MSPFQNGGKSSDLFLVEVGARSFLVNAKASILLEALGRSGVTEEVISFVESRTAAKISLGELTASIARLPRELFDAGMALKAATPIRYRLILVPASLVARLTIPLVALFSAPAVSIVVMAGMVAAPFSYMAARDGLTTSSGAWDSPLIFVVGFFVSALLHELGHATAMARYGVAPGHIGCGIYWFFPVLYTDVNRAWRLPPKGRVIVDSGGIYFQALLIVALTASAFLGVGTEPIRLLILYNLYSIFHSLNPFFKMDGYWILSDLMRTPNLHRRMRNWLLRSAVSDGLPGRVRPLVMLYALSVCAYSIYFVRLIPVAIREHLRPRLNETAAQIPVLLEACRDQAWQAAGESLGRAMRSGLVPALSAGLFLVWAAGIVRNVLPAVGGWKRHQARELTR